MNARTVKRKKYLKLFQFQQNNNYFFGKKYFKKAVAIKTRDEYNGIHKRTRNLGNTSGVSTPTPTKPKLWSSP